MRERRPRPHITGGTYRHALGGARLALAALESIALAVNFRALGTSSFEVDNFFCYFTIQSAFLTVIVLNVSAVLTLAGRAESRPFHMVRSILVGYVILAGIVYGILAVCSQSTIDPMDVTWSDVVLHFVMPVLMVGDLRMEHRLTPRTDALPWMTVGWALPFPGVWLLFTLIRGSIVGWFPYFFLDLRIVGSPFAMLGYCLIVVALIVGLCTGVFALGRIPALTPADAVAAIAGAVAAGNAAVASVASIGAALVTGGADPVASGAAGSARWGSSRMGIVQMGVARATSVSATRAGGRATASSAHITGAAGATGAGAGRSRPARATLAAVHLHQRMPAHTRWIAAAPVVASPTPTAACSFLDRARLARLHPLGVIARPPERTRLLSHRRSCLAAHHPRLRELQASGRSSTKSSSRRSPTRNRLVPTLANPLFT